MKLAKKLLATTFVLLMVVSSLLNWPFWISVVFGLATLILVFLPTDSKDK